MTALNTNSELPKAQPGFFGIGSKVLLLALPLMVGSLAAAGQSVAKLTLLTYGSDPDALFTMAMVQPGFILMLAFMESLAIANQVFSSKAFKDWAKGDIFRSTKVLTIAGTILIALIAAAVWGAQSIIPEDHVIHPVLPDMSLFLLSFIPFFLFELRNAALRGQGRTALALIPFAVLIVVDLGVTATAIMVYNMGFEAVLIGNIVGAVVAFPIISYLLRREIGDAAPSTDGTFKRNMLRMIIGVAIPIFMTTFAGSIAAAVIFPMLANLDKDAASGFLLIIRLRVLFIIPAIASGSAIAIIINKEGEAGDIDETKRVLIHGAGVIALIYAIATLVLYLFHDVALGPFISDENAALETVATTLLLQLILTFFFIAIGTMLQVILEHLGWGVMVLIATIAAEAITVGWALMLLKQGGDLPALMQVMTIVAGLSMLAFLAFYLRMMKTLEKTRAV